MINENSILLKQGLTQKEYEFYLTLCRKIGTVLSDDNNPNFISPFRVRYFEPKDVEKIEATLQFKNVGDYILRLSSDQKDTVFSICLLDNSFSYVKRFKMGTATELLKSQNLPAFHFQLFLAMMNFQALVSTYTPPFFIKHEYSNNITQANIFDNQYSRETIIANVKANIRENDLFAKLILFMAVKHYFNLTVKDDKAVEIDINTLPINDYYQHVKIYLEALEKLPAQNSHFEGYSKAQDIFGNKNKINGSDNPIDDYKKFMKEFFPHLQNSKQLSSSVKATRELFFLLIKKENQKVILMFKRKLRKF